MQILPLLDRPRTNTSADDSANEHQSAGSSKVCVKLVKRTC